MSVLDGSEWQATDAPRAPLRLVAGSAEGDGPGLVARSTRFKVPKIVDYLIVAAVMLVLL